MRSRWVSAGVGAMPLEPACQASWSPDGTSCRPRGYPLTAHGWLMAALLRRPPALAHRQHCALPALVNSSLTCPPRSHAPGGGAHHK